MCVNQAEPTWCSAASPWHLPACHACRLLFYHRFAVVFVLHPLCLNPFLLLYPPVPWAGQKKDKTTDARRQWTDACDATLVTTLRACKDEGLQSDSGWKPVVWTRSADALKDSPGPVKTATKCQDHWGKSVTLSTDYANSMIVDAVPSSKAPSKLCEKYAGPRDLVGMMG
jgi:hypothetical protein